MLREGRVTPWHGEKMYAVGDVRCFGLCSVDACFIVIGLLGWVCLALAVTAAAVLYYHIHICNSHYVDRTIWWHGGSTN